MPNEQRESLTDPLWRRYERTLLLRIAYRERELIELHEDYLQLELRCACLMAAIRRQAERDTLERVNRAAKAFNDG